MTERKMPMRGNIISARSASYFLFFRSLRLFREAMIFSVAYAAPAATMAKPTRPRIL